MLRKAFLSLAAVLAGAGLFAQQLQPLPVDPEVRTGVLDNGMSYYIRHNAKPANQAEFWIMHNVGALQEEDSQQGLAHFLEHMAFNGTKNFPDKNLLNWCESVGIKFGEDLNAFTTQEFTCYQLSNVPLTRESIVDSCLLILHDWSYFITLDGDEIDDERGVIIEELRQRQDAAWRLNEKESPLLYGDNRYSTRNVIGSIEGLRSFSHKELRDFYHRWYRTDQQALIIVGDFDVDEMEAKIKKVMADIPAVENPEAKQTITIADNVEPIVGVFTDPEQTRTIVKMFYKSQPIPTEYRNTVQAYAQKILDYFLVYITNDRLQELAMQPGAKFTSAGMQYYNAVNAIDMLRVQAYGHDGEALSTFESVYSELEKISRFGFTESEFEVAKANFLRDNQRAYDKRDDRLHSDFIWTYIYNFMSNEPMMDIETDYQITEALLTDLTADMFNEYAKARLTDQNQIVIIEAPESSANIPTVAQVEETIAKVQNAEMEGNADSGEIAPLMPKGTRLKGSKVKNTETDMFGATVWTLKNGVKVVVMPTDYKADEVIISANSFGGASVLADDELLSAQVLPNFFELSGVGQSDANTLRKQLAGKNAYVSLSLEDYTNSFIAGGSPKDMETILQLLYLSFTQPRFNEADFDVMMNKLNAAYANAQSNPMFRFQQELMATRSGNSPRRQMLSYDNLDQVDFNKLQAIYNKLYSNADDFTFTIVGDIDLATLRPLVEKYLGSLPSTKQSYSWVDDGVRMPLGKVENRFTNTMELPKTTVFTIVSGEMPYTLENELAMEIMSQLLSIRYTATMREEKGGTYGVGTGGAVSLLPTSQYLLMSQYQTDPERLVDLRGDIVGEIALMAENGPSADDLMKIKEYMTKAFPETIKQNQYWLSVLDNYHVEGADLHSGYMDIVNSFTPEYFKDLAARIIADGNVMEVIMEPAAE